MFNIPTLYLAGRAGYVLDTAQIVYGLPLISRHTVMVLSLNLSRIDPIAMMSLFVAADLLLIPAQSPLQILVSLFCWHGIQHRLLASQPFQQKVRGRQGNMIIGSPETLNLLILCSKPLLCLRIHNPDFLLRALLATSSFGHDSAHPLVGVEGESTSCQHGHPSP